jgi:hypothetical protein
MAKLMLQGEVQVFCQEGGYAAYGITVDDRDLGEAIATELGVDRPEIIHTTGKITVEINDEFEESSPGFFRQIEVAKNG